jgi:hypothetical protein
MIESLLKWPDGWIWKGTDFLTLVSRKSKFFLFLSLVKPEPDDKILDVGVDSHFYRGSNYLELWYPHPRNITAVTNQDLERYREFRKAFPEVRLIHGDGRSLGFEDESFDIVFSNAVVEHVGFDWEQKKFIHELCRVGKKVFVTTPSFWFPFDSHSLLPFVHWFPEPFKRGILKALDLEMWANPRVLNLLSMNRFKSLFPKGLPVRFVKRRFLGMTGILIAVVDKSNPR